jgi:parvulin-like peptidyl-prolyl isomerase
MGSWNIQRVTNELNAVSEKQKKWIRTEENLKDFITGLINREYILEKAKEEKLDEITSYKENVRENFDSYLLSIVENKIIEKIKIPGDSVKAFYAGNVKLFTSMPEIKLSSILLDDKIISETITEQLQSGASFALLARKYSIQKIPAERGGDIGYYKKDELENFGDEIFRLKIDEWMGPLSFEGKYLFVKCTGYKQSSVKSLEESYGEIERWLANAKWYKEKDKYVDSLKKKNETKIFSDKLTKIKI